MISDPMIPRVTVRDPEDGILIAMALKFYSHGMIATYSDLSRQPGRDAATVFLAMIDETARIAELISAIDVMPTTDDTTDSTTEKKD